jgi:hypothetical protein
LFALPEGDGNGPCQCNAVVKAAALHWLQGEELVVRYDLPTARSFATSFCRTCGSPLPHLTRSGREAIVPAGTFDGDLGVKPERHAQWASRADWYGAGTELPKEDLVFDLRTGRH